MKLRTSTPDLVARAFAEAVASGEHEAAEGWLAVAAYAERRHASGRRRRSGRTGSAPRPGRRLIEPAA